MHDELAVSRRVVLASGAASAVVVGIPVAAAETTGPTPQPVLSQVAITVNGTKHSMDVDTRTTLLDLLRERLQLTGTKKGCDHGQCGACTAIVNGQVINACLSLAVMHAGDDVLTIEGLGRPDELHPMQAAFIKHDGYQCGYCTPGQICSAVAVLNEIKAGAPSHVTADLTRKPRVTTDELRERMSGNICRCGAYSNIAAAIADVAGQRASSPLPISAPRPHPKLLWRRDHRVRDLSPAALICST
jgi:xanthine dehydrogenase YagT iron-sulfur-binding subunit